MALASEEEPVDTLTWVFVSARSGIMQTLVSGGGYTITQTDGGSSFKSQLTVNGLQSSNEGSYFCHGRFSNGSALARSQEINLFAQIVYNNYTPCEKEKVDSTTTSRCVLFVGEVVPPLSPSDATSTNTTTKAVTRPPVTTTVAEQANTTKSVANSTEGTSGMETAGPNQPRDDEESDYVKNVVLYSAVGAAVVLIIVITLLVLFVCLCNRSCDCCGLCS